MEIETDMKIKSNMEIKTDMKIETDMEIETDILGPLSLQVVVMIRKVAQRLLGATSLLLVKRDAIPNTGAIFLDRS